MRLNNIKKRYIVLILLLLLGGLAGTAHSRLSITNCPPTSTATVGTLYSYPFLSDSTGYTWSISSGTTPNLTINATTGVLSGTPNTPGTYNFTILYYRNHGNQDSCVSTINVVALGCYFVGGSTGSISFGVLDPSSYPAPVNNTVTQQINFQCAAGLAYSIAVTNPVGQLQLTGANTIPFTLGLHANGTGAGAVDIPLLTTNSAITNYAGFVEGVSSFSNPITVEISWAGGSLSAYVNVSDVTVIPACGTPTNGTMNFDIDPSLNTTITASTTANGTSPTVKCTNASQPNVTCETSGGSTAGQLKKGTDNINYNVTTCGVSGKITGNGFGAAPASEIPVGISVVPSAYQSAPPGDYSDNVTVTIAY